ncbi:phage tail protein, partial [Enterobacteriaceae bacterium G50]|nr:phage tail protein [Enterobacteriaceae bacterium G50]
TENYDSSNFSIVSADPLRISLQNIFDYRPITSHALMNSTPVGIVAGIQNGSQMPGAGINPSVGVVTVRGWRDNSARDCCFQFSFSNYFQGFRPANSTSVDNYWYGNWVKIYTALNTTKASDGTLKAASPIVQIYSDGSFQLNDESEGCTVSRLRVGEYLIEGCTGLNADAAWGGIDGGFDIPTDRNKQPLVWLDYEVNADGSILVKTYHRTHPAAPAFARNEITGLTDGEPIDIPKDQFVSVRVEMPESSIWNQKQKAIPEECEMISD